jgi:5-(carboxyamino)imidazole ribonucleotide mutase
LLSISQMPGGVPVACVGIGAAGARNAALLAAQILAADHKEIREAYLKYKQDLAKG